MVRRNSSVAARVARHDADQKRPEREGGHAHAEPYCTACAKAASGHLSYVGERNAHLILSSPARPGA